MGKKGLLRIAVITVVLLGVLACSTGGGEPAEEAHSACELVVFSAAQDAYYPLAQEIAAAEAAPLATDLQAALDCRPTTLLWVVSPQGLSQAAMIAFGRALQEQQAVVSSGIITASTLEGARELWQRRQEASAERVVAANAANPAAHIYSGRLVDYSPDGLRNTALTLESFQAALQTADYLTFTGHGANRYLRLDEDVTLKAEDVPELDGLVIATGNCQTLRPWQDGSIALGFIERGAAGYTGFVFSPNEGYLLGEFSGLPFRYTWPEFPLGLALQVQNRGTLQGFAHFPYQFLLGDPRLALQSEAPTQVVSDELNGRRRTLVLSGAPAGILPIRVPDGAQYRFVRVSGVTAAAQGDPFYNSRLQMVDLGMDKYLLLEQAGGAITLELSRTPPWYWYPLDLSLDSLDHALIFSQQASGELLALAFALLPLGWVGVQLVRKRSVRPRLGRRELSLALVVGTGAALLQYGYVFLRLERVTTISKTVVFSPLSLLATVLLVGCGFLIYLQAGRWWGKLAGLLVATFAAWAPLVFALLVIAGINLLFAVPQIGTPLYNYNLALMAAPAFGVLSVGAWRVFGFFSRGYTSKIDTSVPANGR